MAITKREIEHVAALARIKLSEQEKEKMAHELGAILGYIDKLKEVDTEGVDPERSREGTQRASASYGIEPVAHITGLENITRKDMDMKKPLEEQAADATRLVQMAPDSKDNFVKVPAVFGDS